MRAKNQERQPRRGESGEKIRRNVKKIKEERKKEER